MGTLTPASDNWPQMTPTPLPGAGGSYDDTVIKARLTALETLTETQATQFSTLSSRVSALETVSWALISTVTLEGATDHTFTFPACARLRLRWWGLRAENGGSLARDLGVRVNGLSTSIYHFGGWRQTKTLNSNPSGTTNFNGSGTAPSDQWQVGQYAQGGTAADTWSTGECIITQSPDRTRPSFHCVGNVTVRSDAITQWLQFGLALFTTPADLTSLTLLEHPTNSLTGAFMLEGMI